VSAAAWPSVVLGLLAWTVALWRCAELAWRAPAAAPQLAAALVQRLARDDDARARALCEALPRCWAAQCAGAALRQASSRAELAGLMLEQHSAYRSRAELGLGALGAFGRMAFPLALGSAIIALSTPLAGGAGTAQVELALGAALQCITAGLLTSVFCRTSRDVLRALAARRLREISVVSAALRNLGQP